MKHSWTRRELVLSAVAAAASLPLGSLVARSEDTADIDKRAALLNLLDPGARQSYIPAGFFIHFDKAYYQGPQAVEKHLEFYRSTGMDFVKIQYENRFPSIPDIKSPADWARMPFYTEDFYEPQLRVVEGLVKAAKNEALVLCTLYSPYMLAAQTAGRELVSAHIEENPGKFKQGIEIITDSLLGFIRECVRIGVDGFYHSTQGGESFRFDGHGPFNECIKPYDLAVMEEADRSCIFNILHVCDHYGSYDNFETFLEYPGHVVNVPLTVGSRQITPTQASAMFGGRPFMGGMDRLGAIHSGSEDEARQAAEAALVLASEKFILGADCTVPGDTSWGNMRAAISAAHSYRRS
jgi:uroporphyrinogen decarboxylase